MRVHVLDANALYRFMTKGDGFETVRDVFKQAREADLHVMMSVVAWGEVYYTLVKRFGIAKTENMMAQTIQITGLHLVSVDEADARKAAELKAKYNIPYADAFTAALTGSQHVVVTADFEHFGHIPKLRILKHPPHKN